MSLMIEDILNRPLFEGTEILTGKKSLDREIKWVHIVEIAKFGHLLNGGEIILTTGLGWVHDENKSLFFLQQLLDYNASALFIELFTHKEPLPKKMIELAEKNDFPIISFKNEVRFIDITKDLHELLLGHHESLWWDLESLYNKLNKQLFSDGKVGDFLRILYESSSKKTVWKHNGQYQFFPSPSNKQQQKWIKILESNDNTKYFNNTLELFENKISTLYYLENKKSIDQFDKMALKRCNEMINQYFTKHLKKEETLQEYRNKWIFEAIIGKIKHDEIAVKIQQEFAGIEMKEAVIAVNPISNFFIYNRNNQNLDVPYIMYLRKVLLKHGFKLLTVKDNTESNYILLLLNQQSHNIKERLKQALNYVSYHNTDPLIHKELKWISFGKIITNYEDIKESYNAAISTLNYQKNIKILKEPFYNNLGIYRIIEQTGNNNFLKEIILDYLEPLLTYDKNKNTVLVKTLQVYFKNSEVKQDTADELHIVRQTLYQRLNRIESLIGDNYAEPENRFMMEFSIHALKYVNI